MLIGIGIIVAAAAALAIRFRHDLMLRFKNAGVASPIKKATGLMNACEFVTDAKGNRLTRSLADWMLFDNKSYQESRFKDFIYHIRMCKYTWREYGHGFSGRLDLGFGRQYRIHWNPSTSELVLQDIQAFRLWIFERSQSSERVLHEVRADFGKLLTEEIEHQMVWACIGDLLPRHERSC